MKNKYQISNKAYFYLNEIFKILKKFSINRNEINWTKLKTFTYKQVSGVRSIEDTHDIIRQSIRKLNDNHSYFLPAELIKSQTTETTEKSLMPSGKIIKSNIGYISLPLLSGFSKNKLIQKYISTTHKHIEKVERKGINKWIVDLQNNSGGNMWPMLVAIGPLLQAKKVGAFITPNGKKTNWYYRDGKIFEGSQVRAETNNPYKKKPSYSYLAVLIGNNTLSSGEAIAVAFKGRPKTKFFGQPSRGMSTANRGFGLSDGSILFLSVSYFADRKGNIYKKGIKPDVIYKNNSQSLKSAIEWLGKK